MLAWVRVPLERREFVGRERELAELADRVAPNRAAPARDSDHRRFELFDAVGEFLAAITASSAALLVLEDLHAADEGSLLLLSFLERQLHDTSLLVVAT